MDSIAQTAAELLDAGETFVLATIVSHTGSIPRTSGTRMIVTADGRGVGTIGGGVIEAGAMSRAAALIRDGASALLPFDLSHTTVETMDMICGGCADVLLDCIGPTEINKTVFFRWRDLLDAGGQGWLLTVVDTQDSDVQRIGHCLLTSDGGMIGGWPLAEDQRKRVADAARGAGATRTLPVEGGFVVVEPARRPTTVHLFGAGHVALSTAAMAAMTGFRVTVADDREEFANAERFPDAADVRVLDSFEAAMNGESMGPGDFIVILTRGHLYDKTVLAQALKTGAGYIGMIGSRKKRDAIYRDLRKEGFVDAEIDRVHSPIGLSIGAETPQEIAVSIVAELIATKAGVA